MPVNLKKKISENLERRRKKRTEYSHRDLHLPHIFLSPGGAVTPLFWISLLLCSFLCRLIKLCLTWPSLPPSLLPLELETMGHLKPLGMGTPILPCLCVSSHTISWPVPQGCYLLASPYKRRQDSKRISCTCCSGQRKDKEAFSDMWSSVFAMDISLYPICYKQVDHITISTDTSLIKLFKPFFSTTL